VKEKAKCSHAVSCSEISVDEAQVGQVLHTTSDLQPHLQQLQYSDILQTLQSLQRLPSPVYFMTNSAIKRKVIHAQAIHTFEHFNQI